MTALTYTGTDLDDFGLWADEYEQWISERATIPARIRLFDGDWNEVGEVVDRMDGSSASIIYNDVGPITVELPIDMHDREGTWLAHWALDEDARSTSLIHVIVEKDGARIGGQLHPDTGVTLQSGPDGAKVVLSFLEDNHQLRNVHVAANPFLPVSLIQQPKVQFLFGPADWVLKASLAMNLFRLQFTNFNLANDILDPANWSGGLWAQSQIVVKPGKIGDSVAPTTIMTGTIKQSWLEIAQPILEDAELQIVTRRWLVGDPEPWPGAGTNWRNGTLFVDIVDKSGWLKGTSMGGNLATGMLRTIAGFTSNYVEDSYDLLSGAPVDTSGYKLPGFLSTQPEHPYVVYIDSELSPLPEFELTRAPGGPCRITAGGQSMPGVNPLLHACIGYAGDVLGDNINISGYGVGSLGEILTAFLMPILENSVLAYMSVPLLGRAARQGWGHSLETACQGVTQAYTPAAIMDLRTRRRETDPKTSFNFTAADGAWIVGDNGVGHWFLGDRVGATTRYLGGRVFTRRCRELTLPLAGDAVWEPKFGDLRADLDPIERAIGMISQTFGALNQIGIM